MEITASSTQTSLISKEVKPWNPYSKVPTTLFIRFIIHTVYTAKTTVLSFTAYSRTKKCTLERASRVSYVQQIKFVCVIVYRTHNFKYGAVAVMRLALNLPPSIGNF
jgi:hypothetical protein